MVMLKSLEKVCLFCRRQELRELRLLQKEEQRAQQQLSNKLQQQKEQLFRRFEQEMTVSTLIPSIYLFTLNILIHCLLYTLLFCP